MAMNTAFRWARENDAHAVVLIDGDGQHDPAEIPRVLRLVLEGRADVTVGSRFVGVKSETPRYRMLGQLVLTVATRVGSGIRLTDCQSGFRSFSRRAIEGLHFARSKVGDVECEMQFLFREGRLRVTEVPIVVRYHENAKRNPVSQGLGNLFTVLCLSAERYVLGKYRPHGAR